MIDVVIFASFVKTGGKVQARQSYVRIVERFVQARVRFIRTGANLELIDVTDGETYAISVATFVTLDDTKSASDQFAGRSGLSKLGN